MSVSELADRLQMSRATAHRWESGDIRNIKLPVIESIARELRCNPAWLIGKSDRKEIWSDASGNPRYNEITVLLEEVIQFVECSKNLTSCGSRIDSSKQRSLVAGLKVVLAVAKE